MHENTLSVHRRVASIRKGYEHSQDVVKKETKKDDLNKEVRDALTRKAGAPSQISLHSS